MTDIFSAIKGIDQAFREVPSTNQNVGEHERLLP